jgi:hypothetical protein
VNQIVSKGEVCAQKTRGQETANPNQNEHDAYKSCNGLCHNSLLYQVIELNSHERRLRLFDQRAKT